MKHREPLITIRFRDREEVMAVKRAARKEGMTVNKFCRWVILLSQRVGNELTGGQS